MRFIFADTGARDYSLAIASRKAFSQMIPGTRLAHC
jgi:hypothetical protein